MNCQTLTSTEADYVRQVAPMFDSGFSLTRNSGSVENLYLRRSSEYLDHTVCGRFPTDFPKPCLPPAVRLELPHGVSPHLRRKG